MELLGIGNTMDYRASPRIAYQIHGHMGYVNESGIPLLLRNILVATIGEGGTEVLLIKILEKKAFEELPHQLGDEAYPCYEILVSNSTGKKIKVPATEIKHLTINWKLSGYKISGKC